MAIAALGGSDTLFDDRPPAFFARWKLRVTFRMLHELTKALVNLIEKNHTAILSIGGTIAGGIGTFFMDRWRNSGKVSIQIIDVRRQGSPDWKAVEQIACYFSLRMLNTFPIEKSLVILGVKFFSARPHWWNRVAPAFFDDAPRIGYDRGETRPDRDLQLAARAFTAKKTGHH